MQGDNGCLVVAQLANLFRHRADLMRLHGQEHIVVRRGLVDGAGLDIGGMQRCAVFQVQRHAIGLNGFQIFAARNEGDMVA